MITTFTGKNSYMIKDALSQRVAEHKSAYKDLSFEQFDGEDIRIDDLREAIQAMPFLTPKKMVVVRGISERKDIHDEFIQTLDNVGEDTEVIVADAKLDKRGALYKVLSKYDLHDFSELSESELVRWIQKEAKKYELELDYRLGRLLLERAGENQWILASELQKLSHAGQPVSETLLLDMVEEHPRESIFQLLDAVVQGNAAGANKLYTKLLQMQLDPHYVMSMLVWQLHLLGFVMSANTPNSSDIARSAKASPYVIKKLQGSSKNISKQQYKVMLDLVFATDLQIKSAPVDADSVVQQLITKLAAISL